MRDMVRHRLDSISDCSRRGYNLRISCLKCDHVVEADTLELMREMSIELVKMPLGKFESRARCTECGHRGATVTPCEINF